eukprot:6210569-Pleurochrysis_carterae.AAC.3
MRECARALGRVWGLAGIGRSRRRAAAAERTAYMQGRVRASKALYVCVPMYPICRPSARLPFYLSAYSLGKQPIWTVPAACISDDHGSLWSILMCYAHLQRLPCAPQPTRSRIDTNIGTPQCRSTQQP